jgi:non-canonical purine NTP pyrophosphatase (RdgB/HAM1 family)
MNELVIATQNPGKIAELRVLLAEVPVRVLGLDDAGGPFPEPPETGQTFEDNAALKARAYAELTGLACLADDSGLEVDALDGLPGVDSAWYAYESEAAAKADPREIRDPRNNTKLLSRLECVPPEERTARFVCCMALAVPKSTKGGPPSTKGGPPSTKEGPLSTKGGSPITKGGWLPAALRPTLHSQTHTGNLPHWSLPQATYHITFRLKQGKLSLQEQKIVYDACLFWHGKRAWVHAAVVMPDHVHLLLRLHPAHPSLPDLLHSIKSYSANLINKLRGREGPLWQREYHDRIIRGDKDMASVFRYIESNPVKAGLVTKPGEYEFLWRQVPGRLEAAPPCGGVVAPHCGEVVALPCGEVVATTCGTFEGRIGIPPRIPAGTHGFGYDPLFLVAPHYERTSAELTSEEKNSMSHRGKAARSMAQKIAALVTQK